MNNQTKTTGLRHVFIYANPSLYAEFPPKKDSTLDIALLRAANLALRRAEQDLADVFLFILPHTNASDVEAINNYYFPNSEVIFFDEEITGDKMGDDELSEVIASKIEQWLDKKHFGAIAYLPQNEYKDVNFWWSGIEAYQSTIDWAFDINAFTETLPLCHRAKAKTWLNVLAYTLVNVEERYHKEQATAFAATLCEWLHGFEVASEYELNNNFKPYSFVSSVGPSEFFLGYEAARLTELDLEDFCNEHECDFVDFAGIALKLVTENLRGRLCFVLTDFFNGDSNLLWVLYSTIQSKFNMPIRDACDDFSSSKYNASFNDEKFEQQQFSNMWSFVTEGWSDLAD